MTREEAIKRLKEARFTVQPYLYMNEAFDVAIEALSQPERPKGRWELIHDDWNVYQCTECKEWWTLKCATPQENNMNFCPFCGADMRDGEEE